MYRYKGNTYIICILILVYIPYKIQQKHIQDCISLVPSLKPFQVSKFFLKIHLHSLIQHQSCIQAPKETSFSFLESYQNVLKAIKISELKELLSEIHSKMKNIPPLA